MTTWTIDTTLGEIQADRMQNTLFDTAAGSDITPTFVFRERQLGDARERHTALQPLVDAAVEGVTIRTPITSTGRPYYREELAGYPDVDSLLVALVPDDGEARGAVWAVLRGASDATPAVESGVYVWELELTVLQRYDGENRATIESEYRDEVI